MNRRRPERFTLGGFGAVVRRHFTDPTFYARRFRASRLGGRPVTSAPNFAATAVARFGALLAEALRSYSRRVAKRPASPPSAVDRRLARPAAFGPALLIGSAAALATLDTPRTAPFVSTLIPVGGSILAGMGLLGAVDYIGSRWPWADAVLYWAELFLALASVVAGFALTSRAVGFPLEYWGLWFLFHHLASWWKGRREDG